ncbi:hypothetical protein CDD83_4911 [Cordyceps sp. RAO-2017]|nr:hypothetical protein CDD83_4911 [Cordyceps sp. RAO-2017]
MPRNESPDNTVMRDVPPGEETGIYYIIISGLPFGTIWQLLKDWLRQAGCDVDHIEVFQKSTSGWVRLIGKDNFERALQHLQTVPYNNRLLLYLDKNRTESVKIMELIDDPPPKPKLGGSSQASRPRSKLRAPQHHVARGLQERGRPHAAACANYPAAAAAAGPMPAVEVGPAPCYYGASPELPGMPDEPQNRYCVPAEPFGLGGWGPQYGSAYSPAYRPAEQAGNPAPFRREQDLSGCRYVRLEPVSHRPAKASSWAGSTGNGTGLSDRSPTASHETDSESCRVHILSLKQGASPREVEEWVRSSMGEWASAMCRIDVPSDHAKGRSIRGSGHITFLSSAAAKRAVELLNKRPFLGHLVQARLDREADKGGRDQGGQGRRSEPRQPGPPTARQSEDGQAAAQRDPATKLDTKHAPPVIAHGTCYRPK